MQAAKGGKSAAGRSPINEQATRRSGKEVEFSQPLKGSALIKGVEGTQVVLDLAIEAKQRITSQPNDMQ